jgi:uncharacterized protein (TIGR03435 family)
MVLSIVKAVLTVLIAAAQTQDAKPGPARFEVAAIHPAGPAADTEPSGCSTGSGLVRCVNVTLKRCIVGAYGVRPHQVLGGPEWIDTDRFQITARAEQPVGDKPLMAMMQILLAERFKLAFHQEQRSGEIMVLEVARTGPKLSPAPADARSSGHNLHDHLEVTKITIGEFAEILARNLDVPVEDHTGLVGEFNFVLRWNPTDASVHDREEALHALRSEVSAAVAKQLGLTLKSRKARVKVLVIDSAEKPSGN